MTFFFFVKFMAQCVAWEKAHNKLLLWYLISRRHLCPSPFARLCIFTAIGWKSEHCLPVEDTLTAVVYHSSQHINYSSASAMWVCSWIYDLRVRQTKVKSLKYFSVETWRDLSYLLKKEYFVSMTSNIGNRYSWEKMLMGLKYPH